MNSAPTDHDILIRLDERVGTMHDMVQKLTNDHESRIRKLEKDNNRMIGKQTVLSGIFSVALVGADVFLRMIGK